MHNRELVMLAGFVIAMLFQLATPNGVVTNSIFNSAGMTRVDNRAIREKLVCEMLQDSDVDYDALHVTATAASGVDVTRQLCQSSRSLSSALALNIVGAFKMPLMANNSLYAQSFNYLASFYVSRATFSAIGIPFRDQRYELLVLSAKARFSESELIALASSVGPLKSWRRVNVSFPMLLTGNAKVKSSTVLLVSAAGVGRRSFPVPAFIYKHYIKIEKTKAATFAPRGEIWYAIVNTRSHQILIEARTNN